MSLPFALAQRLDSIQPFYVMELVKAADALAAQGRSIIHMSIGEPDFSAPPPVLEALRAAMAAGKSGYTPALGIMPLRAAIAADYQRRYGLNIDPQRVIITAGASGALLLTAATVLDAGAEILMPDPAYPCNRHIVSAFGATPKLVAAGPEKRFQLDAADVRQHWGPATRAALLASPSNPTGTSILPDELRAIHREVQARQGALIVDEIYSGLSYLDQPQSALALGDDVIVLNSFSKYYNMTGWRLGWMVVPPQMVAAVEKTQQNLFICASALAQHAALACFTPEATEIYEARRAEFRRRRDFLVPALRELGFGIPVEPDGAFYIYADCSGFGIDSNTLAHRILDEAGVCVVPGRDFGDNAPDRWLRFSYATSLDNLREAMARLRPVLAAVRRPA